MNCLMFGSGQYLGPDQGWNAVYIEADKEKYQDLLETVEQFPNISPINALVGFEEGDENSLDSLLSTTKLPKDFDLLSIDIDSYDLAVWHCFTGKPKVVVIEINSALRPGLLQRHNGPRFIGNSFSSTVRVAEDKGYKLVCHTGNLIFVRDDLVNLVGLKKRELSYPETLFLEKWV